MTGRIQKNGKDPDVIVNEKFDTNMLSAARNFFKFNLINLFVFSQLFNIF